MKRHVRKDDLINNESFLDRKERKGRFSILNQMIEYGSSLPLAEVEGVEKEIIESLARKGSIVINDGNIDFAYPVSGLATCHKIELEDGREFFSMCAIDSLGTAFTFHQKVIIDSECAVSGEPIHIEIADDRIVKSYPPDIHAIHVNLKKFSDWSSSCWNIMNFFRGEKEMLEYYTENELDYETTFGLTLEEAFEAGKYTFYREEEI